MTKALRELRIKDDVHLVRPASTLDSFSEIAKILYAANPEVFDLWFNEDRERGIKVLTHLCGEPRTFFSYEHMIVVENLCTHEIVGIANVLDDRTRLDYSYDFIRAHDWRTDQIISSYVDGWIDTVKAHDSTVLCLPNFSGTEGQRAYRVSAGKLMNALTGWARRHGYSKIISECQSGDKPSFDFYKTHGFSRYMSDYRLYMDGTIRVPISIIVHKIHA